MSYCIEWSYREANRMVTGDFQSIYGLVNILAPNPNVTRYRIMVETGGPFFWKPIASKDFGFTTQKGEY